MGFSEQDPRFTGLGTGGAPMGGPRYHYDPDAGSRRASSPQFYDDKWFIGEWNNGWIKTANLQRRRRDDQRRRVRTRHRLQAADGPRLRS